MASEFDPGVDPSKLVIGIGVDNSGLKTGLGQAEASVGQFASKVEQQSAKGKKSLESLGDGAKAGADKAAAAQERYLKSLERRILLEQTGGRQTAEYQRVISQQLNVPAERAEPLLKQLADLQKANNAANAGQIGLQQTLRQTRAQANLTANALRQVPAQFTDIVTSLAGGQNPLTVFLQQGGQLKDVFGGVGAAAQALGRYVIGLINPFTVFAGIVASLAVGYRRAADEQQEFLKALVLTGNAAGTTVNALSALASKIGDTTELSTGQAAELVSAFAAAGVAVNKIEEAAVVAFRLQREAGIATEETVRNFAELGKDPLTAVVKLNQSMRFLTVETYQQIKALTEQGRTAEAAAIAQQAFLDAGRTRSAELTKNLDNITLAYRAATEAARNFGNAFLEAFRPQTSEKFEQKLRQDIANIEQALRTGRSDQALPVEARRGGRAGQEAVLESLREQLRLLERVNTQEAERARALGASADNANKLAAFDKDFASLVKDAQSAEQQIAAATKRTEELVKIGLDPARAKRFIDALRASLAPKGGQDTREAELNLQIERIKAALEEEAAAVASQQAILEARRSAGLVAESNYYDQRIDLATRASDAAIAAIDDEIEARSNATLSVNDQLENEKKIVALVSQRIALTNKARTDAQVFGIEQEGRQRREIQFYIEAGQAQERYLDDLRRRSQEDITLLGRGNRAGQDTARVRAEEDRFNQRIRDLQDRRAVQEGLGQFGEEARRRYEFELELLRNFQGQAVDLVRKSNEERLKAEQDWAVGASRALENYVDNVANVASQTESLLTNAFQGAEDAFVKFAQTGRLSFTELADSIISDLIRIAVRQQIVGPLAQAFGFFGGFGGGGPVNTGTVTGADFDIFTQSAKGNVFSGPSISAYSNSIVDKPTFFAKGGNVMGEAGPEAIMPLTRTPDGRLGVQAAGGSGVTVNIIESNERGGEVQRRNDGRGGDILDVFVSRVKAEVANDIRRGSGAVPAALADTYALSRAPGGF